ncbi:MAG: SOUL heme-binding protein [bacterium ADurb.BinA186]|nr:MAG: SOUL heme-binding protein [bacterium ADurb.BinA186]
MGLARYIFGGNHSGAPIATTAPILRSSMGESIAMTAPVLLDTKSNRIQMSFIMPRKYSFTNLPLPDDERIKIEQKSEQWFAVISYFGRSNASKENTMQSDLMHWLKHQEGFQLMNDHPLMAGFDPPWTLAPLRKNELMLPISKISIS